MYKKNIFFKFYYNTKFSIFGILLPPSLVSGPFLSDLFISIIALFFVSISIIKKEFNYLKNKNSRITTTENSDKRSEILLFILDLYFSLLVWLIF